MHAVEYLFHPVFVGPDIGDKGLLLGLVHIQTGHLPGKRGKPGLPSLELLAFAVDQVIIGQVAKLACPLGDIGGDSLLLVDLLDLVIA